MRNLIHKCGVYRAALRGDAMRFDLRITAAPRPDARRAKTGYSFSAASRTRSVRSALRNVADAGQPAESTTHPEPPGVRRQKAAAGIGGCPAESSQGAKRSASDDLRRGCTPPRSIAWSVIRGGGKSVIGGRKTKVKMGSPRTLCEEWEGKRS